MAENTKENEKIEQLKFDFDDYTIKSETIN